MSYNRHYIGTRSENDARALQDCKEFLGDKFPQVVEILREECRLAMMRRTDVYRFVAFNLSVLVGIEGYYPVRAMVREVLK